MDITFLTSWQLVGLAGTDADGARRAFALRYESFVRRVLAKRWLGTEYGVDFDDAIQDVFVECFKAGGVIEKADPARGASFRTLLFQVTSHVAARFERTRRRDRAHTHDVTPPDDVPAPDLSGYEAVTREEVSDLVREAHRRMATHHDAVVRERATLLDRHTCRGESILSIAGGDHAAAARLHREHSKAKKEWKAYLVEVVKGEYRVPEGEAKILVADLLGAFS